MTTFFSTAESHRDDSYEAGQEALKKAFDSLNGKPHVALIFSSPRYEMDSVLKGVQDQLGSDVPIIGTSTYETYTQLGVAKKSVSVGLISSDSYRFKVAISSTENGDLKKMFTELKDQLYDFSKEEGKTTALMFYDGLSEWADEATLEIQAAFDHNVKIIGGGASDDLINRKTYILCNGQVLTNSIALCMVKGPQHFFSGLKHGHEPLTGSLQAIKSQNRRIYTISDQETFNVWDMSINAFDVWKNKTREEAKKFGLDVDHLKSTSDIIEYLVQFELGYEVGNDYKIRAPLALNDDGSISFNCTVPEGAHFKIMKSSKEKQIESAEKAAQEAMSQKMSNPVSGILIFDCICRSIILKDRFIQSIKAIRETAGLDLPLLGFGTYGEINMEPFQFSSGFYNTTCVVALIPGD